MVPDSVLTGGGDQHDTWRRRDGIEHVRHCGGRRSVGRLHHQGERAVDTGAEPVGQPVVCLPGGRAGRIVAGVGDGQSHGHHRDGEGQQDRCPADGCDDRAPLYPRPNGAQASPASLITTPAMHAEAVDATPGQAEECRQQGDGGRHGHQHGGRGAERQTLEEAEPHQQEAEQRDHHRATGEHDRSAGRAQRLHRGGVGIEPRRRAVR